MTVKPGKGIYVRDHYGRMWIIEGIGEKRVIVRYLMTSRRYYHKRREFDRGLEAGLYSLYQNFHDM